MAFVFYLIFVENISKHLSHRCRYACDLRSARLFMSSISMRNRQIFHVSFGNYIRFPLKTVYQFWWMEKCSIIQTIRHIWYWMLPSVHFPLVIFLKLLLALLSICCGLVFCFWCRRKCQCKYVLLDVFSRAIYERMHVVLDQYCNREPGHVWYGIKSSINEL